MLPRHFLLWTSLPLALTLAACSEDPTAPPETPEIDLHVISAKCDFMTGGGSVVAGGGRVTFGVHAGRSKGGTVFGHFTVVDHRTDTRYQSTQITAYGRALAPFFVSVPPGGVTRVVEGRVRINGGTVQSFTAYLNDSGEPGKGVDRIFFRVGGTQIISASPVGGLPALRLLSGGNLQYHDHCIPGKPQSGK